MLAIVARTVGPTCDEHDTAVAEYYLALGLWLPCCMRLCMAVVDDVRQTASARTSLLPKKIGQAPAGLDDSGGRNLEI
ncbi:hypothetical protein GUJ93_ZPchr0002g25627 [Zizania palustris]|uniref:Uncharacterized protein n=1 Tax=Zizania palustris TaxID=103762 RepID=A0A8J5VR08_ZIZPA|nr:hypothetical protein GUJ93_ZPchr0002g25627 [Zizania palustris]